VEWLYDYNIKMLQISLWNLIYKTRQLKINGCMYNIM